MLYYRIERKALPIGDRVRPHIFSTLFCEFVLFLFQSFSTAATTSQLFAAPLRSQHFSFVTSSFDLFPSLLSSVQLIPSLSQPISTLLNSCQLFSTVAKCSQLFSPLFTEMLCTAKLLHTQASTHRSFYTEQAFAQRSFYSKFLHREACTNRKLLHTARFDTQQGFAQRSFYTQKALNREAFARSKL